ALIAGTLAARAFAGTARTRTRRAGQSLGNGTGNCQRRAHHRRTLPLRIVTALILTAPVLPPLELPLRRLAPLELPLRRLARTEGIPVARLALAFGGVRMPRRMRDIAVGLAALAPMLALTLRRIAVTLLSMRATLPLRTRIVVAIA